MTEGGRMVRLDSTEGGGEEYPSFEKFPQEEIEAETVTVISKEKRDSSFLSEEERKRFKLDPSAESKLRGCLDQAVVDTRVESFKKHIVSNFEIFGKSQEAARKLSELQVRHIMEGCPDEVIKIAGRDPKYAEMIHLREILKKASGKMDYDEKLMFFRRINGGIIKDPALLRELQIKLWEAKEGESFDETALGKIGEQEKGGKEKYVKGKVEEYKTEGLCVAMGIDDKIQDKIEEKRKELGEEKSVKLSDDEVKKIIIQEVREKIVKETGSEWTDEEIIALGKKNYNFSQAKSTGIPFFKKIKMGRKSTSLKEWKKVIDEEKTTVVSEIKSTTEDAGNKWDLKMIETKDRIITEALEEIPIESAKRVYEKYKKIRLFNVAVENKIKENKKIGRIFTQEYGDKDKVVELGEIADELYNCDDVGGFTEKVNRLPEGGLKSYMIAQSEKFTDKGEQEKLFWFLEFFKFIFGFLAEQEGKKNLNQVKPKTDIGQDKRNKK